MSSNYRLADAPMEMVRRQPEKVRLGIAQLLDGVRWPQLAGASMLAFSVLFRQPDDPR